MLTQTKKRAKSNTATLESESNCIDAWISAGETFLSMYSTDGRATEIDREKFNAAEHGFIADDEIVVLSYSNGSLWLNTWNTNDPMQDSCRLAHELPFSVRAVVKSCMLDLIPSNGGQGGDNPVCTLDEIAAKHGRITN